MNRVTFWADRIGPFWTMDSTANLLNYPTFEGFFIFSWAKQVHTKLEILYIVVSAPLKSRFS